MRFPSSRDVPPLLLLALIVLWSWKMPGAMLWVLGYIVVIGLGAFVVGLGSWLLDRWKQRRAA